MMRLQKRTGCFTEDPKGNEERRSHLGRTKNRDLAALLVRSETVNRYRPSQKKRIPVSLPSTDRGFVAEISRSAPATKGHTDKQSGIL